MQARRLVPSLVLAAAALAGCGDPEVAETKPVPVAPAPAEPPAPAPVARGGGGGGSSEGGGGGGGAPAPREKVVEPEAPQDLQIRLLIHNRVAARGAPIEVLIEVLNISKDPVKLIDGRADLARRTRFVIQRAGVETVAGPGLPAANSVSRDQDVTLAPGQVLAAQVDLLPTFEDTLAYVDGRVRFVAEYVGDTSVVRSGSRGWNSDPVHHVRSKQFDIELRMPDWLADLGATDATLIDARNTATTFQPGVPGADKVAAAFAEKGAPALACLLALTRSMGGMDEQQVEIGRRAFALLRTIGEPALAALSRANPGEDPAMKMTLGVLVEDHDERSGLLPDRDVAKALRTVSSGDPDAATFVIHFTQTKCIESGSWVLDAKGLFTIERGANETVDRTCIRLPVEPLASLKGALLASRFGSWRRTQRIESEDEGSVTFSLCRGDVTVQRVTMAETEALKSNPMAADLVEAFKVIATTPVSKAAAATTK